ncbi:TfoX/Sxy family protein [bacterium]|nr:TfoX/Sxy family protein [bacterium]
MAISGEFLAYVLDQLRGVGGVTSKRMFGGACLFHYGKAFAVIAADVFFLKVDDTNRADFTSRGMEPFRPFVDKNYVMSYYEVPAEVLEDMDELALWANKAIAVAEKTAKSKRKKNK